jgi:predicted N-acyltransferase
MSDPKKTPEKTSVKKTAETITLRIHSAMSEIAPEAWDACAGDVNPTVSHAFLNALEESGSATARAGWAPQHLTFADGGGRLVGAVPMYLKSHSYGEYVFDWGWADAYERTGNRYYPKLLCAVPFTPVPGPRLLVAPDAAAETKSHLIAGMVELVRQRKLSSLHINFPEAAEFEVFAEAGFLQRIGQQFHWTNEGYRDFDDYLAALNSRKRKAVKKERREALDVRQEMGLGLPDPPLFFDDRRADARQCRLDHGAAPRRVHRRRLQHPRPRHDLRPQLGRLPRIPVPAFRMLLLPGDRIRD